MRLALRFKAASFLALLVMVMLSTSLSLEAGGKKKADPAKKDNASEVDDPSRAHEISAKAWLNTDNLKLAELRGNVVVIDFRAVSNETCKQSIPHLIELWEKYQTKEFALISVTDEPAKVVEPFVKNMNVHWPVACGSKSAKAYKVKTIPQAFIIDRHGTIAWQGNPMNGLEEELDNIFGVASKPSSKAGSERGTISLKGILKYYPSDVQSVQAFRGHNFMIDDVPIKPSDYVAHETLETFVGKQVVVIGDWIIEERTHPDSGLPQPEGETHASEQVLAALSIRMEGKEP